MIRSPASAREETAEKAGELKERATESIAGGLAQLKHIRSHLKEGVGKGAQVQLDKAIETATTLVETIALLNLSEDTVPVFPEVIICDAAALRSLLHRLLTVKDGDPTGDAEIPPQAPEVLEAVESVRVK